MKTKQTRAPMPVIGKCGNLNVVEFQKDGAGAKYPLLDFGEQSMGVRKVQAVLDNLEAAREFVAKYGKAEPVAVDQAKAAELAAENARLLAELAALKAKPAKSAPVRFTSAVVENGELRAA